MPVQALPRPEAPTERRSSRRDRRDPARAGAAPGGLERRVGERRRPLPRPLWRQWPSLLVSAALGVVVAAALQSGPGAAAPAWAAGLPARVVRPSPPPPPLRFSASAAAALRDEAERLTPAGATLDEQARDRWWPLRAELEAAAAEPATPPGVLADLRATLAALDGVGL